MNLFQSMLKKTSKEIRIGSPATGDCHPLSKVNDPTFRDGLLGNGVAIQPSSGQIVAPADGKINSLFPSGHAVVLTTADGVEILIHIGLDTVNLNGEGFTSHVKEGDFVKKGDLLIEADLNLIKKEGYDTIIPVIICNTADYLSVNGITYSDIKTSDDIILITLE